MIGKPIRSTQDHCPRHGRYTSDLMEFRAGAKMHRWWMGCPVCILQHHQSRHGQGVPDLHEVHRPRLEA